MISERKEKTILRLSFAAGLAFALAELIFAIYSHSQSALTDAVYDASELVFIALLLFLTPLFHKPVSEKHPYGYFQVESIFLIVKGVMMLSVTLGVGIEVIESALSGLGLWSEAVENGRCIVPVRAFYETRNVDGGTGGRKPQYRFASAGGTALLLAGLRLGDRFVLVTCEPDAVVGRVHSRMPLSLTAPEALAWLDRSTDARDLLARHAPVPLEAQEEPAPTRRPSDSDQMSLF